MKICPTCQQQFPVGFRYCPTDTELLLTVEEYARRTQPSAPVTVPPLAKTPPVTEIIARPPVERRTERQPERVVETAPLPFRQAAPTGSATDVPISSRKIQPVEPPPTVSRKSPIISEKTGKVEGAGMSFILPEQGSVFHQLREGFDQYFKYFGKSAPVAQGEGRFVIPEQAGLFTGLREGFGQFVKYFGKSAPVGANEFLVPESGNILKRLRDATRLFIQDYGKNPPELKPGELGEFAFLLKDEPIYTRFGRELSQSAADFRRDPRGFIMSVIRGDGTTKRRQRLLQAGVAAAMITYAFIFTSLLLVGLFSFGRAEKTAEQKLDVVALLPPNMDVQVPEKLPKGKGDFAGGSKPKPQQAHGGGGGGREQLTPPSKGRPPQMALTPQIVPPDPEPPKIKNPSLPVPSTVYGDPKTLPELKGPIGDPQGAPAPPSSGPGKGDGIGRGTGSGVGPGEGGGVGPGRGGNAGGGDMSLGGRGGVLDMGKDGVGRIQILYKEKAKYTEEARQNKVQGTVVLSAVFTSDGRVTNVRVIRGLPDGLTEKAIEAAQKIRFQPATKNGSAVTVRGQLEFTFNLY